MAIGYRDKHHTKVHYHLTFPPHWKSKQNLQISLGTKKVRFEIRVLCEAVSEFTCITTINTAYY